MSVLDIRYKSKKLDVFVFNQPVIEDKLKEMIVKNYKKVLSLHSVIQKFGIEKFQLILLLKSYNIKTIRIFPYFDPKRNIFNFLLCLVYKRYLIVFFFNCIILNHKKKIGFFFFFTLCEVSKIFTSKKKKINFFFSRFIFLRKINGFIKTSLFTKTLENVIYIFSKKEISLKINNVFLNKGFTRVPIFGKRFIKPVFRFQFFTVFLACVYRSSQLIGHYLSKVVAKNKQHRKSLAIFSSFIEKVIFSKILVLAGFQVRVTGKLGGKMRKSKYHYKFGIVKLQSFGHSLSYICVPSYTKFGIISIKVWLVQSDGFTKKTT